MLFYMIFDRVCYCGCSVALGIILLHILQVTPTKPKSDKSYTPGMSAKKKLHFISSTSSQEAVQVS